ncbi:hypothetical protein GF322_01045 [Candidatus Dependentiae bacterium]|nr:hypothetical protein [Candidatus Dependentiae bacterium]
MFQLGKKNFICIIAFFSLSFSYNLFSKSIFKKLSDFNAQNWTRTRQFFDNFYEIVPNKFYRSKQLDSKKLGQYIDKYKFAAVVNLRGENPDKKWWVKEKEICEKKNVLFYNIAMSAVRLPSKNHLKKLIDIFENVQGPIYVHCQGGADRTGMATAIYMMLMQHKTNKEALQYLAIKYGHRKYKNSAMDFFVNIWQGRDWALKIYDPADYSK